MYGFDSRCSRLVLIPTRRWQTPWTSLTYALTHASWTHLTNNLMLQLMLGCPLEMVHGFVRTATIYTLGAAGAGLARSALRRGWQGPGARPLTGASGTVLALNPHLLPHSPNLGKPHMAYSTRREKRISKLYYKFFPHLPPFGRTFGGTSFCRLHFMI